MIRTTSLLLITWVLLRALSAPASQPSHATALLFLDKSGSMQKTDPACVRWEAVDLLLELMQNEDRAALFAFGTDVDDLSGSVVRLDDSVRRELRERDGRCTAKDKYTDLLVVLRTAERVVADLGSAAREAYPPTVVVLTDGVDDVASPGPNRSGEIEEALDSLRELGARVFAVGLSSGADRNLLQKMKDRTGGEIALLEQPKDLLGSFFRFSRELAGRWLLWEGTVTGSRMSVTVPSWAQEITAIYVPERPDDRGEFRTAEVSAAVTTKHYRVLKFQARGQREIEFTLPASGGHLIVDCSGDLVLAAPVPPRVPFEVPFQARLEIRAGGEHAIGPARFLDQATARLAWRDQAGREEQVFLYDDGMHDDDAAGDGVFGGRVMTHLKDSVTYTAEVKAPYSRPLHARGSTTIVVGAATTTVPNPIGSARASVASKHDWLISNETDVAVPVRLEYLLDGEVVGRESVSIPPAGDVTVSQEVPRSWIEKQKMGVRIFEGDQPTPSSTTERTVWPIGWLAIVALALLLLLILSFFFPRRTASGAMVSVYHYASEGEEPTARTVKLAGNGPLMGIEVPPPFDDPGTFTAQSGVWRRGVKYRPAPGLVPRFSGHRPRRAGDGWIIRKTATWISNHDGQQAKYTFKTPR